MPDVSSVSASVDDDDDQDSDSSLEEASSVSRADSSLPKSLRTHRKTAASSNQTPQSSSTEAPGVRKQKREYHDSSNSDNDSYFKPRGGKRNYMEGETLDYGRHRGGVWGRMLLWNNIPEHERDLLLGLAMNGGHDDEVRSRSNQPATAISLPPHNINPLANLSSTPLPCSLLTALGESMTKLSDFDDGLEGSFRESAAVAVGMLTEESITASLLPLAGLHALRCRELENKRRSQTTGFLGGRQKKRILTHPITGQPVPIDDSFIEWDEDPFEEWTLPPEEALLKLLQQGFIQDDGIQLIAQPTRVVSEQTTAPSLDGDAMLALLDVDKKLLNENRELFRLFVQSKTSKSYKRTTSQKVGGVQPRKRKT